MAIPPANVSINSDLDMGGHRITGVGPAEKPTDAVNKQQVDQALRGLTGWQTMQQDNMQASGR